jgi:O-acetylhomoserine (thiol)-lyase
MRQHVANAQAVAEFLQGQSGVSRVSYPGLASNPHHALASKYLPDGPGAVFCFDLAGGRDDGKKFIESLSLFSHLANVGDAKSLVIHPASTTHRQLNDDELDRAGITPGTIRISVGIEDADDLIWDLQQGFHALEKTT